MLMEKGIKMVVGNCKNMLNALCFELAVVPGASGSTVRMVVPSASGSTGCDTILKNRSQITSAFN